MRVTSDATRAMRVMTGLCVAVLLLATGACSPITRTTGSIVQEEDLALIRVGRSNRAEVASVLGSPTTTSTFGGEAWYYIGQVSQQRAFLPKRVETRKVVIIRFDENDRVASIETRNADDGEDVNLVSRETPTSGRDFTILQQLFGNLGRYSGPMDN